MSKRYRGTTDIVPSKYTDLTTEGGETGTLEK
jgi:hypothetical protein